MNNLPTAALQRGRRLSDRAWIFSKIQKFHPCNNSCRGEEGEACPPFRDIERDRRNNQHRAPLRRDDTSRADAQDSHHGDEASVIQTILLMVGKLENMFNNTKTI